MVIPPCRLAGGATWEARLRGGSSNTVSSRTLSSETVPLYGPSMCRVTNDFASFDFVPTNTSGPTLTSLLNSTQPEPRTPLHSRLEPSLRIFSTTRTPNVKPQSKTQIGTRNESQKPGLSPLQQRAFKGVISGYIFNGYSRLAAQAPYFVLPFAAGTFILCFRLHCFISFLSVASSVGARLCCCSCASRARREAQDSRLGSRNSELGESLVFKSGVVPPDTLYCASSSGVVICLPFGSLHIMGYFDPARLWDSGLCTLRACVDGFRLRPSQSQASCLCVRKLCVGLGTVRPLSPLHICHSVRLRARLGPLLRYGLLLWCYGCVHKSSAGDGRFFSCSVARCTSSGRRLARFCLSFIFSFSPLPFFRSFAPVLLLHIPFVHSY